MYQFTNKAMRFLPGNVFIGVDLAKEGDTCVEWQIDSQGNIHVLDVYKSRETAKED